MKKERTVVIFENYTPKEQSNIIGNYDDCGRFIGYVDLGLEATMYKLSVKAKAKTFNELGNWAVGRQGAIQGINEVFTEIQIERKEAIIDELDKQFFAWSDQFHTVLRSGVQGQIPIETQISWLAKANEQRGIILDFRDILEEQIKSMKEGN